MSQGHSAPLDPLASKAELNDFLDVLDKLNQAGETDERLVLSDLLHKKSTSVAIKRYALIQREIDLLDVVMPMLVLSSGRNITEGNVNVACNILQLIETLIQAESSAGFKGTSSSHRNLAILLQHDSLPLYRIVKLLGILPPVKSSSATLERFACITTSASRILLSALERGDKQDVDELKELQDPKVGGW
ncbi:hypothetical protein HKX48_000894 [Thoreauomyces humboldtii]|nr:hypothetical protein HKX48_000894 [Thoreauomyces humboldtii]